MSHAKEKAFVEAVKHKLDAQADGLDERTLAKLRAARMCALDEAPERGWHWMPALGTATAMAMVLAVLLWPSTSEVPGMLDDWEIVASQDDLEMIEEFEFYEWLEATEAAG
jgi:hypothetical protein